MKKIKVINGRLNENLNGVNFNNTPSETIFSFGSFSITSNFSGRNYIDFSKKLNSFAKPIDLNSIDITDVESDLLTFFSGKPKLNLDRKKIDNFVRFGSAIELIKESVSKIVYNYPGSLFINSQYARGGNITYFDFQYNETTNTSTFKIPSIIISNDFDIIFNEGNLNIFNNNELKNINISYDKYIVWSGEFSDKYDFKVINYIGDSETKPYIELNVIGNPFFDVSVSGNTDFHIRPNIQIFNDYLLNLGDFEKFILGRDVGINGFEVILADPTQNDDGEIILTDVKLMWPKIDGYNIDIKTNRYKTHLNALLTVGNKYDSYKTDMIYRHLCVDSLKVYDQSEDEKIKKLLRIYGSEFDLMREYVSSILYINRLSYDKKNNLPDQLISNYAKTLGWDYFSIINEGELLDILFGENTIDYGLKNSITPIEFDIELWRRILINSKYFWKSKGTRDVIKSMFMMVGVPEEFINISEYVYTVDGRIDTQSVILTEDDFPSNSFPFDSDGFPKAPLENNQFYFQCDGNLDFGERYMNVFRNAGFSISPVIDNRKSWVNAGPIYRFDEESPTYYQKDSKLVLNTKIIDVNLDAARGLEYDVFNYVKYVDYPAHSGDFVLNNLYVNIGLDVTGATQTTFIIPPQYVNFRGDIEVRFNGILLNSPKIFDGIDILPETNDADYEIIGNTITLKNSNYASTIDGDVIKVTFVSGDNLIPDIDLEYVVTRLDSSIYGAIINLPTIPSGDIQLTIDGITLVKKTNDFDGDYVISETGVLTITNPTLITYLSNNPYLQLTYLKINDKDIISRSEISRIDSFSGGGKIYYSITLNRFVFKLNYLVNNPNEVKVLVNGLMIQPFGDYNINPNNKYEVILPNGVGLGDVIVVYYLTASGSFLTPLIPTVFGIGDVSKMSFLEFIEAITSKLINARNRKIISNYNGGWYPTLLKVYLDYLDRYNLSLDNPMKSNGYLFNELFEFLKKYNGFFSRFVEKLLPATIILRKGGILYRNSIFTKQKFMYRRGVSFNSALEYHGDDSSMFLKEMPVSTYMWGDEYVDVLESQEPTQTDLGV